MEQGLVALDRIELDLHLIVHLINQQAEFLIVLGKCQIMNQKIFTKWGANQNACEYEATK